MDPLVQSARDALEQGNKNKAMELIKQVFTSNPNDIEALVLLATLVDEPMRKRQVLNRVLSLDATNRAARDMMLAMDRAEMQSYISRPVGTPNPATTSAPDATRSFESQTPRKSSSFSLEKPMTFRYSPTWMVVLYIFTTFSCCATFWFASMDVRNSLPFLAMAIVLGLTALTVSSRVEANETAIRVSTLIGSTGMDWGDIANIKVNTMKRSLELTSNTGEVANISTQTTGYKTIIEILRFKRPDLTEPLFASRPIATASTQFTPASQMVQHEASAISMPTLSQPVSPTPTVADRTQTPSADHNDPVDAASKQQPAKPAEVKQERPLVFRFPLFWRIFMYAFPIFFGCLGLLLAYENVLYGAPLILLALVLGLIAAAFSPSVEITEAGIRTQHLLNSAEANWNEIVHMKSNAMSRRLELAKGNGEIVKVSNQVSGYPRIVEILRQKRPDLFSLASQSTTSVSSGADSNEGTREPVFTGTKIFKKKAFAQYGVILLMIPLCLFGVWALVATEEAFVGISVILIGLFFMVMSLFNVNQLKVEPGRITTESFFSQKEYTAKQIRDITMKTVRSRQGIATNYVNIQPVSGGSIRLLGFSEGDEVIYGILREWWESYRNK